MRKKVILSTEENLVVCPFCGAKTDVELYNDNFESFLKQVCDHLDWWQDFCVSCPEGWEVWFSARIKSIRAIDDEGAENLKVAASLCRIPYYENEVLISDENKEKEILDCIHSGTYWLEFEDCPGQYYNPGT